MSLRWAGRNGSRAPLHIKYKIGVRPDYTLEFESKAPVQDAHYVLCRTTVRAEGIPKGRAWTLTASASDGADVSVQLEKDLNPYVRNGFWLDREMDGDRVTDVSVRGGRSLKSTDTGSVEVCLFLPENVSDNDRTVTLSLAVEGAPVSETVMTTVVQKCPAWTSVGFGWEQMDDGHLAPFGFQWDYKVAYIYPYTIRVTGSYSERNIRNRIQGIIDQYRAANYTDLVIYNHSLVAKRFYVQIDYSKLSDLAGNGISVTDGYKNTMELRALGGTVATCAFEQALNSTYKFENGKEEELAFRLPDAGDPAAVPRPSGTKDMESAMLSEVLKRNRYHLRIIKENDILTRSPYLRDEDVVWSVPAYGQFSYMPDAIISPLDPGATWSSTTAAGLNACLGNGTEDLRQNNHSVRAVRNR